MQKPLLHMNQLLTFALILAAQAASAGEITLPVASEGWSLKFEAPALTEIKLPNAAAGHVYTGNAGKIFLSLHVYAPDCEGGDSSEDLYKCFGAKMQRNPYIVNGSIAAYEAPGGVQITYLMEVPAREGKVRAFNLNYVFSRNGKWGDLHISVAQFAESDLETVKTLMSTLQFVETKE